MYNILNINEDKPTGQQTWNDLYTIQEKDWKKIKKTRPKKKRRYVLKVLTVPVMYFIKTTCSN